MHSGPSTKYRIIGSINVGTKLTTLKSNNTTKFTQIKTPTGRVGWVNSSQIQDEEPAKALLPALQEKYQESQAKLNEINSKNEQANASKEQAILNKDSLIAQLESEKRSLRSTIEELEARNKELDILQDTKEERIQMQWLMGGGSVLFVGILFGLIIPFLPRRRKRSENW